MRKTLLAFLSLLIVSTSYASYPQEVTVCLNVERNDSPLKFQGWFYSSDLFDGGSKTGGTVIGTTCVSHTYNQGPKNLKVGVKALDMDERQANLIRLDNSCAFLTNRLNADVQSANYQRATDRHLYWDFSLVQEEPRNGYKYNFLLKCKNWTA